MRRIGEEDDEDQYSITRNDRVINEITYYFAALVILTQNKDDIQCTVYCIMFLWVKLFDTLCTVTFKLLSMWISAWVCC